MAGIDDLHDLLRVEGGEKARPAGSAVEFRLRRKERLPGDDIDIDALLLVVPVGVAEGGFGSAFAGDVVLLAGEALTEFFEGVGHGARGGERIL